MSLAEQLTRDLKQAIKDKDKVSLSLIRMVKSSLMNEQIKLGRELTADDELTLLAREVKQRKESLEEYDKGGRDDLVAGIRAELAALATYLPTQLSIDELQAIIATAIAETGAQSPLDMGKVMGKVTPQVTGRADGKQVADLVKAALTMS